MRMVWVPRVSYVALAGSAGFVPTDWMLEKLSFSAGFPSALISESRVGALDGATSAVLTLCTPEKLKGARWISRSFLSSSQMRPSSVFRCLRSCSAWLQKRRTFCCSSSISALPFSMVSSSSMSRLILRRSESARAASACCAVVAASAISRFAIKASKAATWMSVPSKIEFSMPYSVGSL